MYFKRSGNLLCDLYSSPKPTLPLPFLLSTAAPNALDNSLVVPFEL